MEDDQLSAFVHSLPKTETHLHIEGALSWHLLQSVNAEKYKTDPASWADDFRFRDFAHFEGELLAYAGDWFISPERYHESAKCIFEEHLESNVKYVECSFASGCIDFMNLDGKAVMSAIRSAVPKGLEVRIFLGIHHSGYSEKMGSVLEESLKWEDLDGIDLHGPEDEPMGDWAPLFYQRARDAGKYTKAHAGEFCGPDFVRYVIEDLGVQRIEHGERSDEDPRVVDLLKERGIALDMCPISNIKLGVTESSKTHSIRQLTDAGVVCTLSTDDPISFGNTIEDEYILLGQEDHFSRKELVQIARNGFDVALMDVERKQPYLHQLETIMKQEIINR